MFYIILFFLTLYNFWLSIKNFIKENMIVKDGKCAEIPNSVFLSLGLIAIFHIMVLAICLIPAILFH